MKKRKFYRVYYGDWMFTDVEAEDEQEARTLALADYREYGAKDESEFTVREITEAEMVLAAI